MPITMKEYGLGSTQSSARNLGLKMLDALLITSDYSMTQEQSEAVRTWVALGGHLLVSIGKHEAGYRNSPLAGWLSQEEDPAAPF